MQGTMEAILNEVKKVVTGKDDAVLKVMLASLLVAIYL